MGTDPFVYAYKSTYTRGKLTLNPSGPWCDAGTLKAKNVTAVNYSSQDPPLTGILKFHLVIEGDFTNAPGYHFVIDATYEGQPEVKYDADDRPPGIPEGDGLRRDHHHHSCHLTNGGPGCRDPIIGGRRKGRLRAERGCQSIFSTAGPRVSRKRFIERGALPS